ncbi:hypothetical protein GOV04_02485 [Candidatus Woesearchaeota archaeon]|nr:hypothetical protein [Candidatus Woesearchaeota archaeon]
MKKIKNLILIVGILIVLIISYFSFNFIYEKEENYSSSKIYKQDAIASQAKLNFLKESVITNDISKCAELNKYTERDVKECEFVFYLIKFISTQNFECKQISLETGKILCEAISANDINLCYEDKLSDKEKTFCSLTINKEFKNKVLNNDTRVCQYQDFAEIIDDWKFICDLFFL